MSTGEPHTGPYALRDIVRCLRETGRYVDDEGEATNALDDLADCVVEIGAALENIRLYAARHRKQEWAQDVLRLCLDANVIDSPLRVTPAPSASGSLPRCQSHATLDALRKMVHEGTVFVSAWVVFDEVRSYRVTARGRDGWRKTGDAKTLEDAIHEADATNWSPAPRL